MRRAGDALAWEAISVGAADGEVRVVTLAAAAHEAPPAGLASQVSPGLEYDQVVELMEWADKVVVW